MSVEVSAIILAWVAILILTLAVAGLISQVRALAARSRGGAPLGLAEGVHLGTPVGVLVPRPALVLALKADCGTCAARVNDTLAFASDRELDHLVWGVVVGDSEVADADYYEPLRLIAQESGLSSLLPTRILPYAVLVDGSGRIRWGSPVGSADIASECVRRLTDLVSEGASSEPGG